MGYVYTIEIFGNTHEYFRDHLILHLRYFLKQAANGPLTIYTVCKDSEILNVNYVMDSYGLEKESTLSHYCADLVIKQ